MKERRQHLRVPIHAPVICRAPGLDALPATVADISLGGARLKSDWVPPYGTELILVVMLPGHPQPLELPATVRWTSATNFGVQFAQLGAKETHRIARLIAQEALPTLRPPASPELDAGQPLG